MDMHKRQTNVLSGDLLFSKSKFIGQSEEGLISGRINDVNLMIDENTEEIS